MTHRSLTEAIKGLPLGGPFSKLAARLVQTARTDSSFSNNATLASSTRNHDTQPLHYTAKKQYAPTRSMALSTDVKKHKQMSTLKDKRILR